MPKLLFVSKGILKRTGGAETAAYHILQGILKQNNTNSVIILTNKVKSSMEIKELSVSYMLSLKKEIKIYSIPLIKPRLPIYTDYFDAKRFKIWIRNIIVRENIDLIHIHAYSTFYITPDPSWKVPVLYTFHDFPIKWPKNPINCFPINYIEKFWYFIAKKYWQFLLSDKNSLVSSLYFHCNGSDSRDHLLHKGVNKQHILLLANGYKSLELNKNQKFETISAKLLDLFDPQNQKLKLLAVGQFNNIKNQKTLINGFIKFSEDNKDSILFLIGRPSPIIGSFYIRKILKSLNKKQRQNIVWFGFVPNIILIGLYKIADLIVLTSYSEASPLILEECKNMGKGLLSTRVGALKDLLPADLTKLDPNSPELLTDELKRIYQNKEVLKNYESLINNSELPTWDDIGNKISKFYEFMISNKKG
ncbi:MAG: glycosyltransferase family 4 protein [Candidatus Hermodarchaeota archaeon]